MWLIVLLAAVVGANPQYTKSGYSGVKGGHTYPSYGNGSQQGYRGPTYPGYDESGVGVCFIEVPTASLVRDPSQVPAGNGSRPELSRIRSCCKGYIRNIHNYRLCEPVCTEDCINAICTAPETCNCYPDHVKNNVGICVATCPIGCQNGRCAGGECICNDGYKLDRDSKYCMPSCPDNCGSMGDCTGPNTCTCKTGYESTPTGSCRPTCINDCRNGDCVAPNECRCKQGYSKDRSGVCGPTCAQDCGVNGRCIAPNVCNNPSTTTTPPQYHPYQPYNPSNNQHNPQPNPLHSNPQNPNHQYPANATNNPYNPESQRPYYSNNPNQQNNGQFYYPTVNNQPTNFTSDSQIKPNQPEPYNPINHTLNYPNGPNSNPANQTNPYGLYQPYNPTNPNQPTNYYPYNPSGQPGQHPSGQPDQYPSNQNGQPGQYPSGQPGQYPSGQPGQYPSGQPGQYPSGQPGQYPSGQPGQYPSGQPGQYPSGQPGQYPSGQPGQYPNSQYPNQPSPGHTNHSNPNLAYYPNNQYPYYPYDQTGNEDLVPRCSQPCINGVCVEGNRCSCNPGYELDNSDPSGTRCRPHCAGGCQNGVCSAPNFCICNMGYRKEHGVKGGNARCVKRMKRSILQYVNRRVSETYKYTYLEAYEDDDCLICSCTKSRQAINTGTRLVEKLVNETVTVCCDGYTKDDSFDGYGLKCVPVCNPPCHNGYCRRPNECACEPGYTIDPNDILNRCVPLCLDGCSVQDCLPTCNQYGDYDMCFDTCFNGTCVAPGVCHCNPGFKRVSDTCEPICSSCDHGTCVAPNQCNCDPGWQEKCGSCQPICFGCEHGTCKAPNLCECDDGYEVKNGKCEPVCLSCNGNCISPNVCVCDPGWYMNEAGTECLAHCDVACGNGSCVAPNHCECHPGYRIKSRQEGGDRWYTEATLCVPECSNCTWLCVAPEVCECEDHYETIYKTADGQECDCLDCANSSIKCDILSCRKSFNETMLNISQRINESKTVDEQDDLFYPVVFKNVTLNSFIKKSINDTSALYAINTAKFTYHWIYTAIIIVELIIILFLLSLLMKRLKTKVYEPQDKQYPEGTVHYTSSVTCSKLKKTGELDI